ncbi:MAG: hypothetical protein CMB53_01250 [Euryarchaeota archaeon]|nr:hypothetical protein [Euryarchaeota archaeon]|tara:strand:+ start:715 stop:1038 length:324 start_codon:yes stop_codon:yes gene_type:complete
MQGGQDAGEALKLVAQELQAVMSQIQTVNSQISELSMTLESLESQDPEKLVYRAVGSLLLEVSDRDSLKSDIETSMNSFQAHLDRLSERESELRENYDELVKSFESQ